jgi:proton-translocating NADH-quinone oxidoreductase chain L
MPTPALLLLIATLLPLASFVLLVFVGKRMGKPLAGWVGAAAIGLGFACSLGAMVSWFNGAEDWGMGKAPISLLMNWVPAGLEQGQVRFLDIGIYVDSVTVLMFFMVTLISTLIHIFSIGYMAEDKRFGRFFTYLSLFCFSMLGLVLGGTILQLFIFWELVGLCSYLLIGFWYEKKSASNAAIKAFVTNRVGDVGFLIGLGILFYYLGNVTLPDVWAALDATKATAQGIQISPGVWFTPTLLTVMGVGLFFGAMGKSAQFPLHVWLPDAMEGPTPVSALIHAATMVAAGVYLVARIFPILTPDAKLFIAIIGVTTLTMAALIAVVQSDIKKVLAYSTLSQLGYMILAMGIGSWVGGLFHLITHAFFKALLFLGSGSVIHAAHHEQEMPQYGGLFKKIPVTAITFGIAVLAIAGFNIAGVGLSGFYSKDMILAHAAAFGHAAAQGQWSWYWLLFILPTAIAYITPFYMTRCWMLTFAGKPRNPHVHAHAHELPIMWAPLAILAVFSVVVAYEWMPVPVKGLLTSAVEENTHYVKTISPNFDGFGTAWPAENPGGHSVAEGVVAHALTPSQEIHEHGWHTMHTWVMWAPWAGIGLGVLLYWNGYSIVSRFMKIPPLRWIHTWLYRRMYFDELYMGVFVAITIGLSRLGAAFDKYIIDGLVNLAASAVRWLSILAGLNDKYVVDGAVHGAANVTQAIGAAARMPQTGRIRLYVTVLLGVMALGLAAAVMVALSV